MENKNNILTDLETQVLEMLLQESSGNGYDFAFVEDLEGVFDMKAARGALSSLVKKNIITIWDKAGSGTDYTQVTFNNLGYNLKRDPVLEDLLPA
jgi:hypothetical protein